MERGREDKYAEKFVDYRGFTFDDLLLVPGYSEVLVATSSLAKEIRRGVKSHP